MSTHASIIIVIIAIGVAFFAGYIIGENNSTARWSIRYETPAVITPATDVYNPFSSVSAQETYENPLDGIKLNPFE